jgi:Asp-tRNA(Asn)/Glu-tRNA(Gln) amidotransferase A subunit family amidase
VLDGIFVDGVEAVVRDAVDDAAGALIEAGLPQVVVETPDLTDVLDDHYTIYQCEAAAAFHDRDASGAAAAGTYFISALDQGERTRAVEYLQAQGRRADIRRRIDALFDEVDILLTPTTAAQAAWRLDSAPEPPGDRRLRETYVRLCCPFNQTGHPAMSVPAGMHGGLPIGVQLVGRPGAEPVLTAAATALEATYQRRR